MSKLTLNVNPSVVSRAKRYAQRRGVSVSQMVETYLATVTTPPAHADVPPVLRSLRGTLRRTRVEDYGNHLSEKYR